MDDEDNVIRASCVVPVVTRYGCIEVVRDVFAGGDEVDAREATGEVVDGEVVGLNAVGVEVIEVLCEE